ncbi:hypothetical protein [Treponema sp.]|uniref:hypothetical protein n=1 Tax=Treponema sp. TaxID=166 RepID=UPI0025FE7875|nr:hypothetical protein [Treponema sp.]MCR5219284.1 hypothetical protein [Treponema sp.]
MAENRTNKDEEILRMTNVPDFVKNMTPEEYEQLKKDAAERIEEIEKKALERLRDPSRGTLRDYIEK